MPFFRAHQKSHQQAIHCTRLLVPLMQFALSGRNTLSLLVLLGLFSTTLVAAEQYITDEFEVTMRSGTSTANNIVRMLKSGQAVTILEQDLASQYSLVETADGKKGYVLSRYLVDVRSAKERLESLQQVSNKQQQQITELKSEISRLQSEFNKERSDNTALKSTLRASENELARVKNAAANTLSIVDKNSALEATVEQLNKEKTLLSSENTALKDSTGMDWFIRGAAVSLIAFLLGIIITRIRWRKQDSWGSY